ncbi:LuxR C-terminal-related transcriptional regulator [Micromonospora thermarum]|uniref:HTH luxR-type domain-containing protein n=1 Tax=Micromonospora thermarum TaxID=2720024 RepID=A0ABX0Z2W9_9ACTN|nr:LuxR C-terminal-related transcriptional regulator [Micromonospora thermarum]NJP32147.1 hypothetical protein [Micromonospora thermarum]
MSERRPVGRPRHPDVLTPAEWRVVHLLRHGLSDRRIAHLAGVSRDAVRFHVRNAYAKLGLPGRAALRRWSGVPADSALAAAAPHQQGKDGSPVTALLGPVGQVSRTVRDIARSVDWYGSVLGLPHLYTYGDLAFFDCGNLRLYLNRGDDPAARRSSTSPFPTSRPRTTSCGHAGWISSGRHT